MTVQVLLLAGSLSFLLGLILGTLSCYRLRLKGVSWIAEGFSFVVRGIPFFVQLLIVYFVFPELLGFNLDPLAASVLSLGICSSGYVAQIVRGALNAISEAQWEAAHTLGYTPWHAWRRMIFPQILRLILPSLNNELDALLKSTAVISSIGLLELTRVAMNLVSREMQPVPVYLTLALFYLSMSAVLNQITKILEKKFYVKS